MVRESRTRSFPDREGATSHSTIISINTIVMNIITIIVITMIIMAIVNVIVIVHEVSSRCIRQWSSSILKTPGPNSELLRIPQHRVGSTSPHFQSARA